MEIDADAVAVCVEDQRGEVGDGAGGGGYRPRRHGVRRGVGALWHVRTQILQAAHVVLFAGWAFKFLCEIPT
jgi:hypothetical protein